MTEETCIRCGADLHADRETRYRVRMSREREGREETIVSGPLCGTCRERVHAAIEMRETES